MIWFSPHTEVTSTRRTSSSAVLQVAGTSIALALLLVRMRWASAGSAWRQLARAMTSREPFVIVYFDLLFVTVVCGAFLGALLLASRRPAVQRVIAWLYVVVAVLVVLIACVNDKALRELGSPLTYQWLYYADFLRSIDAYNAMNELASWSWLKTVATRCGQLLLGSYLIGRAVHRVGQCVSLRWVATPVVSVLAIALALGHSNAAPAGLDPIKLQNPVVRLVTSALRRDENPLLTTMPTRVPAADFLPAGGRTGSGGTLGRTLRDRARQAGVSNLLIVVLESTGAEYVGAYGSARGVTPNLDGYAQHAMRFTNIYAHVPSTVHSLVTLLLSVYHPHSFRVVTAEYPRLRLPSLTSELRQRGYRTAFFNAGDNRFQREDVFLRARGFHQLEDYRTCPCDGPVFQGSDEEWPFLDGIPDQCVADRAAEWMSYSGEPFFAAVWTNQTHFPYFLTSAPAKLDVAHPDLNRYLNALRETDHALGQLLAALERRRRLDSTLVVVIGDHGETFGQHGHDVHGVDLYDEEIHVPLMLINRQLFQGETDSTLGGLIDVAPTILDILGVPAPEPWQGRSLFDRDRIGRVYLFTPRSRVLFAYREGSRKFIYDAGTNAMELYDLQADPRESLNIARRSPDSSAFAQQRLAAWVQYQQRFFKDVLVPEAR